MTDLYDGVPYFTRELNLCMTPHRAASQLDLEHTNLYNDISNNLPSSTQSRMNLYEYTSLLFAT